MNEGVLVQGGCRGGVPGPDDGDAVRVLFSDVRLEGERGRIGDMVWGWMPFEHGVFG